MALEIKFAIEEAPDARAFRFKDNTGEYSLTGNPTGWGAPNFEHTDIESARLVIRYQNNVEYEYDLPVDIGFGDLWAEGFDIFTEDINYPATIFEDGVYDFRVYITVSETEYPETGDDLWSVVMGFAAVITREVMKESLTYHPSKEKQLKEWIWEQMRLLDNLKYSADTGNLQFFQDNLAQLQKLR